MSYKTIHPSDLYWKINKVHYKGDKYVKLSMTTYYKHSNEICHWIPRKNYKIIRSVYDHWENYTPKKLRK